MAALALPSARDWVGRLPRGHRRLHFNLGTRRLQTLTLRRRVNQLDRASAAKKHLFYGGGKVLPGLVARRQEEAVLIQ